MKNIFLGLFLAGLVFAFPHRALASAGSVILFGEGAGATDAAFLAGSVLTPPDAAYDIAYEIRKGPPKPSEFGDAAVVIVASLNEKSAVKWTPGEVAAAEAWVTAGGTLIFVGNSPVLLSASSQDLDLLSPLVGGKKLRSPVGPQSAVGQSPVTDGLRNAAWMGSGGWALAGLTSAVALLSDGSTAMATVNPLGSGRVYFFGKDISRLSVSTGLHSYVQMIGRAILGGGVVKAPSHREAWELKALGADATPSDGAPLNRRKLQATLRESPAVGDPLQLVLDGVPQAVIVLGDSPSKAAAGAAETLRKELKTLTGADLPLVRESSITLGKSSAGDATDIADASGKRVPYAIVVGDTQVGKSLGVTSEGLPPEGYRALTRGNLLFLCGSDRRPDGWELAGTKFAVSAFLERHCGIRWLWPGELGTVYPKSATLVIPALDERDAPALRIRKLRDAGGGAKRFETDGATGEIRAKASGRRTATSIALLGRDLKTQLARHDQSASWFDQMRLGQSYIAGATHAYSGWWNRHGAKHPEWFSLQPTGFRIQTPPREHFCQSAPGLVDAIAAATVEKFAQDPRRDVVSIAPNDVGANSYCFCAACRRKDPANGAPAPIRYLIGGFPLNGLYPSLSDRMVGFFTEIAGAVDRLRPGAKVGVTAYNAYRAAPIAARLPTNTLLVFVGTNYFDRHVLDADRQNWNRWAASAPELILRPNTLHQGHAMPAVFVKGLSEDLKHGFETGMIGADYDSIVHHWATQGLNYYVLAKLLWDPSLDPEAIVQDFCTKGFGPAAPVIREYFSALESHTEQVAEKMGEITKGALQGQDDEELEAPIGAEFFIKQIPNFYPAEKIAEWRSILARGRSAAAGDKTILERIAFLEEGLTYAKWQTDFFKALAEQPEQSPILKELAARRRLDFGRMFDENYFAIQLGLLLWREEYYWKQAGIRLPDGR